MSVMLVRNDDLNVACPSVYRWFDENGREVGQTELLIPREDVGAESDKEVVEDIPMGMILMEDGLWTLYDVRITDDDILKEMDSVDSILYKVPEPTR